MKRILALALCCLMCAALLPVALADGEGWYLVDSTSPDGYCYLYSAPSDRSAKSYNKGRHDNGELVYVLDYSGGQDGSYSYCHVRTMDGETGYMHDYALTRYTGISAEARADGEGWYIVSSTSPNGYCYLYSAPSDRDEKGCNLGRHDNGERVYVLAYYGGQDGKYNYCRVRTESGETGYMHDYALVRAVEDESAGTGAGWYRVTSFSPEGYCYLYSAPSDRAEKSVNLGRHDNGDLVYVLDYYGGQDGSYNYCRVRTLDGEIGYMHDYALMDYQLYLKQFY